MTKINSPIKKLLRSRRSLFLIMFAIFVAVFTNEYFLSNAVTHFELELTSQENGQMQMYYYSGNDAVPIDELHSIKMPVYASKDKYTIQFDLPLARLRTVRLDIDDVQSLLIHGISISYLGKMKQVPFDLITMPVDCKILIVPDGAQFMKTANDSQLHFGDLRFYNRNILYLSLIAAVISIALTQLVLLLLQRKLIKKYYQYRFLFEELVKRDFKKKYKRTVLGMFWSMLNPLLMLLVMWIVFSSFFGQTMNHYVIYLFAGNIVFSFFNESTNAGMNSLISNAGIFTKVNVPKYMFLLSQSVTSLINFGLTLIVFFAFVAIEGIPFTSTYICLLVPIICLTLFNVGISMILSALFIFFRDIEYLWSVFSMVLMYLSAIFYSIDGYSQKSQYMFLLNPVYVYIRYFRKIVLEGIVPSPWFHILAIGYALLAIGIGCYVYKKNNTRFLYYV